MRKGVKRSLCLFIENSLKLFSINKHNGNGNYI